MVKIAAARVLFVLICLELAATFHLETKGKREGVGVKDSEGDKFGPKGGWRQNRTILEQFYDYIKKERDVIEKRMGNQILDLERVIMKIPKKKEKILKDKSRSKRSNRISSQSNLRNENHITKIKEEIAKLQDLITILKDQRNMIGLLNNVDESKYQKVNFTTFTNEFNDLKHYIKHSLVDKLEKEIKDRKHTDDSLLQELEKQKNALENIQKEFFSTLKIENKSKGVDVGSQNQKEQIINNIVKQLKNLETRLSEMLNNNDNSGDDVLRSQEKTRKSTVEDENGKNSVLTKLLEASQQKKETSSLQKLIENANKKKRQKSLLEELINKIADGNKTENKELDFDTDNNLEDRLKTLEKVIDNLQKSEETSKDTDGENLQEIIEKLLTNTEPVETKPSTVKKDTDLEDVIRKMIQQMNINNSNNFHDRHRKKFNLYNCKHVHSSPDAVPFKFLPAPNENYYPNFGIHEAYYPLPNNYGYGYYQQRHDQNFDQNQLFQNPHQPHSSQPRYIDQHPQEYQTDTLKDFDYITSNRYYSTPKIMDVKNQILNLLNIASDLNNAYAQRPEHYNELYDSNQQSDDIKSINSNLERDRNFPRIGYYGDINENKYERHPHKHHDSNNSNINNNGNEKESNKTADKSRSSENERTKQKDSKQKTKRSTVKKVEEVISEVLKDELKRDGREDDDEEEAGDSNENKLDSSEEAINANERSHYYYTKKSPSSKDVTVFDKIFDKILNKLVDKVQIAVPKIVRSIFDFKSIFGFDLNDNYYIDDGYYNNHNSFGVSNLNFKNFGLLGLLPMFVLKLVATFNFFMNQLRQFPFFKNFLVPALTVLGVSGLTVFLIWWLQPDNNNYNNKYKEIAYQQNQRPPFFNHYSNNYRDRYYSNPHNRPSYMGKFAPSLKGYDTNSLNYDNFYNSHIKFKRDLYNMRRNK